MSGVAEARANRKTERDKIFDIQSEIDTLITAEKYDDETAVQLTSRIAAVEVSSKVYHENVDILIDANKEDPDKYGAYVAEKNRVLDAVQKLVQRKLVWAETYEGIRKKAEFDDVSGVKSQKSQPDSDGEQDSDEVVGTMINEIAKSMYEQFQWADKEKIRELATRKGTLKSKTDVTHNVLSMRRSGPVAASTPYVDGTKSKRRVSFPPAGGLPGDFEQTIAYGKPEPRKKKKKVKKKKRRYIVVSSSSDDSSSDSSDSSDYDSSSSEEALYSLSDTLHGLKLSHTRGKKKKKKSSKADRYIQRVQLPTFDGTGDFDSWWSMFLSIVDESSEPRKIKFLKLKQAVSEEPLELIKNLPHCSESYKRAKRRIYDNYGGILRQVNRRYTEAQEFKRITDNDFKMFRKLLALVDQTIGCLETSGRMNEIGPSALSHCLVGKMPVNVVIRYSEWRAEEKEPDNLYTLSSFLEQYISRGVTAYETVYGVRMKTGGSKKRVLQTRSNENTGNPKAAEDAFQKKFQVKKKCPACNAGMHSLGQCEVFKKKEPDERYKICSTARVCYRCLSDQHYSPECSVEKICGISGCKGKHHRLLHSDRYMNMKRRADSKELGQSRGEEESAATESSTGQQQEADQKTEQEATDLKKNTYVTKQEYKGRTIAMRTLPVRIVNKNGLEVIVNALLDEASTTSYINKDVAAYLDLQGESMYGEVEVFGGQRLMVETELVEITIVSMDRTYTYTEMAEVTDRAVGAMETVDWTTLKEKWPYLKDIPFEPLRKKTVDALLGINFLDAIRSKEDVEGPRGEPVARLSPLGWSCSGVIEKTGQVHRTYFTKYIDPGEDEKLSSLVEKFWKWEDLPDERMVSAEDQLAEKIVEESIVYRDGRYEAGIPWVGGVPPKLPNNYDQAYKRYEQTERKLQTQKRELYQSYIDIFKSYIEKGYLEEVFDDLELDDEGNVWYLSHFAVIRYDKETSKVRPVYDASAVFEGKCLNEHELAGPALQQNLLLVLLRFRLWAVVLGTDISEMYLQIVLKESDRDYQRLLIRLNGEEPPKKYRGTRVMFGRKSSPFIALKVSQENAKRHQDEYPEAALTVLLSTYMDDSMDSRPDVGQALVLYEQLNKLWNLASMKPKKWFANSEEVMSRIPEEDRAAKMDILTQIAPKGKALGSLWSILEDALIFEIEEKIGDLKITTKRGTLKKVAGIFDPLGLITPFTVRARTYIQEMWVRGVDWDEELPNEIQEKVDSWLAEIPDLNQVKVKRCLIRSDEYDKIYVHVFCDASTWIYGSVSYIVTTYQNKEPEVNFIISKGKVAPVKYISVPRLELQGACISVKMSDLLRTLLEGQRVEFVYWTDSLDVLIWIMSFGRAYKTYIANRIGYIQERSQPKEWRYVPTELNPADVLTRGLRARDLTVDSVWFNGPEFILKAEEEWPKIPEQVYKQVPLERKESSSCMLFFTARSDFDFEFLKELAEKYGNWKRVIRFITYVVHFVHKIAGKGMPMLEEKHEVELSLFRLIQHEAWSYDTVKKMYPGLSLFRDEDMVIRHKSRLQKADVYSWEFRNPILLPGDHALVRRLLRSIHEENHVNFSYTWHEAKLRFVIPGGRELCKKIVQTCVTCQLQNAKGMEQMMADLPRRRITRGVRPFLDCSIDYAGPFMVKLGTGRKQGKRWICLINCLSVRAIHLEPVWGLDADKLIMAMDRFTNRRGRPRTMTSDNGTNFIRGNHDLKAELKNTNWEKVESQMNDWNIDWKFQPALSPHHGGVHEILVKLTKSALTKIAGTAGFTDEEFLTLLCRVEGCLNRRPLCYVDSSPDSRVLTPADFIAGTQEIELLPPKPDHEKADSYRERWRLVGKVLRHFWDRWVAEWLTTLRARPKWLKARENIKIGDVVMMLEPGTTLPGRWPLGTITEVHTGDDGLVRSVTIRRDSKEYRRSIVRICPLKMMI